MADRPNTAPGISAQIIGDKALADEIMEKSMAFQPVQLFGRNWQVVQFSRDTRDMTSCTIQLREVT